MKSIASKEKAEQRKEQKDLKPRQAMAKKIMDKAKMKKMKK